MDNKNIQICAVGDISFVGKNLTNANPEVFNSVKSLFLQQDLVIANLECVLTCSENGLPGKCTLKSSVKWAGTLKESGINLVSLANNHIMDFGNEGLIETIKNLTDQNIHFIGAGVNKDEAENPFFFEKDGLRLAILGRSSVEVSTPIYATDNNAGVAFLDEKKLLDQIKTIKSEANKVILILHWGLEHYHYPTMHQRYLSHRLFNAGADIILGHHPHVLQGIEWIDGKPVVYSLGNFVFDDFDWTYKTESEESKNFNITLNNANRQSNILKLNISKDTISKFDLINTKIKKNGIVEIDENNPEKLHSKLSRPFSFPFYNIFWKFYSIKKEWDLRFHNRYGLRNILTKIWKVKPYHFHELISSIRKSANITSGKSTNPYD
jgi:poly-gamma-glutamate capsule biosynthesis protein CapA/YwtB (metallophosphatase superfamily)